MVIESINRISNLDISQQRHRRVLLCSVLSLMAMSRVWNPYPFSTVLYTFHIHLRFTLLKKRDTRSMFNVVNILCYLILQIKYRQFSFLNWRGVEVKLSLSLSLYVYNLVVERTTFSFSTSTLLVLTMVTVVINIVSCLLTRMEHHHGLVLPYA